MSIVERITKLIPEEKKVDALMTFIYSAMQDYLKSDFKNSGISKYVTQEESDLIFNEISNIESYLKNIVITFDTMQYIVTSAKKDKKMYPYYKSIESNLFYYDNIAKSALSKIKQLSKNGEEKWIPDYLCFCLIYDAFENDFSFGHYSFFYEYNFEKVFNIYRKVNKLIKDENNIRTFKHNTMTRKMENVSITMIENLKKSRFKLAPVSPRKK
jgi:hypothetical protein